MRKSWGKRREIFMPTYAEITGQLLKDAAAFFRTLAEQNQTIADQMNQNATVFEQLSVLVLQDPLGKVENDTYAVLAARLLKDAAGFFLELAEKNEPIREQMTMNADVYNQIANLVVSNPYGIIE